MQDIPEQEPALLEPRSNSKSLPRVRQLFLDYEADLGRIDGNHSNERTESFVR